MKYLTLNAKLIYSDFYWRLLSGLFIVITNHELLDLVAEKKSPYYMVSSHQLGI